MSWVHQEVPWKLGSHPCPSTQKQDNWFCSSKPNLTHPAETENDGLPLETLQNAGWVSTDTFYTTRALIIKIVKLKGSCRYTAGSSLQNWLRHRVSKNHSKSHLPHRERPKHALSTFPLSFNLTDLSSRPKLLLAHTMQPDTPRLNSVVSVKESRHHFSSFPSSLLLSCKGQKKMTSGCWLVESMGKFCQNFIYMC